MPDRSPQEVTQLLADWGKGDRSALLVALALAVFGFYTSLAGQPLFRGTLPDD